MDENSGFRRALKRPGTVGGLCLLAVVAVYLNVTDFSSRSDSSLSIPTLLSRSQVSSGSTAAVQAPRHDVSNIKWIEHPFRDPFSSFRPMESNASHSSPDGPPISPEKSVPPFQQLVLKAVAVEDEVKTAVINRMIVREGERVEGFLVLSIRPTGVWLEHNGTRKWLTFHEKNVS